MALLSLHTIQHSNDVMMARSHLWKGMVRSGVELAQQTDLNRGDNLCDVDVNDSGWLKRKDHVAFHL